MDPSLRHHPGAAHHAATYSAADHHDAVADDDNPVADDHHDAPYDDDAAAHHDDPAAHHDDAATPNHDHFATGDTRSDDDHPRAMNEPRSCILIGNGTTVLDHQHGPLIDSFDKVVRFNGYRIEGFEPHVGTKTDCWFNVDLPQYVGRRMEPVYERIYLHSWEPDAAKDGLYQAFKKALPDREIEKVDHGIIEEMVRYAGAPEYRCWSTGALAIWLMLKLHPTISLTGFDWWARKEHHYGDSIARGPLHQPNIEKRLIDRLCADNKVTFL